MSSPEDTPPSGPTPDPAPTKRSRRGLKIALGAGAVVILAAGGAGAYAWQQLSGGGTQPQDVLPASVSAFVRLDADPSASQKIALLRLVQRFPDIADDIGVTSADDDIKRLLLEEAVPNCGLDYDEDLEPWLGDRIGFAVGPDATPLIAVQVTDEDAARTTLPALAECLDLPDPGIVFSEGYAVLSADEKSAKAAVDEAADKPLADSTAFQKDMDELGDQGIASAWVDVPALSADIPGLQEPSGAAVAGGNPFTGVESSALTLRAGSAHLELVGIGRSSEDVTERPGAGLERYSSDNLLVGAYSGGGKDVRERWDAILGEGDTYGYDPSGDIAGIEQATGLRVPEDIETLLGESIALVVGPRNLDTAITGGLSDPTALDIGLVMRSDPDAAADLAQRLADLALRYIGLPLTVVPTDDGAVLATNDTIGAELADGKQEDATSFGDLVPDSDKAFGALVLNIGGTLDMLEKAGPPPEVQSVIDDIRPLDKIGFSAVQDGRVTRGTLRVEFED